MGFLAHSFPLAVGALVPVASSGPRALCGDAVPICIFSRSLRGSRLQAQNERAGPGRACQCQ
eukprot:1675384-Pyramimonas_sp.AAC.1